MSDLIRDSFHQFYAAIGRSYQALNSDRVQIEDRKVKMLKLLEETIHFPDPPTEAGEYQDLCREMMGSAKLQIEGWQELIRRQIDQSEFVNRHEKSILALVFADVNAGKSSLGNFVGGWNFRDTPYEDLYHPHKCEIEDYSKASQENRQVRVIDHFEENATEATSTIQHYTLAQGLTWVDTPGLHSLTTEHGELAQEYVQFADLVIYLTPSSSPFKKDEREMLETLFKMGKPVILAITKSDVTPPLMVQDGKIVRPPLAPKTDETRQVQESFITKELQEIRGNDNMENSHVLSLSVKLARNAVKAENSELYAASNLDRFLSQMGEILSEKAVELKMRRPKAEVNTFINALTGRTDVGRRDILTISQLRKALADKSTELQQVMDNCKAKEPKICAEVEQQMSVSMSLLFRNLRDRKLLNDSEAVKREMSENISKLVAESCQKGLKQLGDTVLSLDLPPVEVKNASGTGYQIQYVEKVLTRKEERAPEGLWENIVHFFDKEKKFYSVVSDTEQIAAGDNFKTFLDAQLESIRPEVRAHVTETLTHIIQACINPLMKCYRDLDKQLEKLTTELEALRFS